MKGLNEVDYNLDGIIGCHYVNRCWKDLRVYVMDLKLLYTVKQIIGFSLVYKGVSCNEMKIDFRPEPELCDTIYHTNTVAPKGNTINP